ncbi:MAG: polysaccharide lyase family 7 protein [Gammaproteobacteria bacterium]|nr:polysaccharide lyase family 7 protein [Gammaproteobacteria bacterium]
MSNWKLTIPSGKDIPNDELNDGYTLEGAFYTDPQTGGMVFRSPNIAGHTSGSKYSRSELREMLDPGASATADSNNWKPEDGGTLQATLRVDRVSTTGDAEKLGRVVIGQIHGPDTEVIRLYFDKKPQEKTGRIYAGHDSISNKNRYSEDIVGNDGGDGIALGEVFGYRIDYRDNDLTVTVSRLSGGKTVYRTAIDSGYVGKNVYFKAGVYNQNNTGDNKDYVQATFFALSQHHPLLNGE